jgi:hypothetical protein
LMCPGERSRRDLRFGCAGEKAGEQQHQENRSERKVMRRTDRRSIDLA